MEWGDKSAQHRHILFRTSLLPRDHAGVQKLVHFLFRNGNGQLLRHSDERPACSACPKLRRALDCFGSVRLCPNACLIRSLLAKSDFLFASPRFLPLTSAGPVCEPASSPPFYNEYVSPRVVISFDPFPPNAHLSQSAHGTDTAATAAVPSTSTENAPTGQRVSNVGLAPLAG